MENGLISAWRRNPASRNPPSKTFLLTRSLWLVCCGAVEHLLWHGTKGQAL